MHSGDDFKQAVEVIPNKFYLAYVRRQDSFRTSPVAASSICYCIDDELLYEPFYADFGPLNLGRTYRFCQTTNELLKEAARVGKKLYLYTGPQAQFKANAAVLVGIYQILYLNASADQAYEVVAPLQPFFPFRDASCGVSTFHLTVLDCLRGIAKAKEVGFLKFSTSGDWLFEVADYEHYEQVEHGDMNWIVPGKFLAFSGPAARATDYVGFRAMTPEDYWEIFRRKGIVAIVRLNKKVYDRKRFTDGGFHHYDMYFPDGSCPTDDIIHRFLDTVEAERGAVAVHCKAGLGRTGVLICCYIMKHYRFTAEEVIGYIRLCRPGSVIGPQQNFIKEMEPFMWREGDLMRAAQARSQASTTNSMAAVTTLRDTSADACVTITVGTQPKTLLQRPSSVQDHVWAPNTPLMNIKPASSTTTTPYNLDMSLTQLQQRLAQDMHLAGKVSGGAGTHISVQGNKTRARAITPMRYTSSSSTHILSPSPVLRPPPRAATAETYSSQAPTTPSPKTPALRASSTDRSQERNVSMAMRSTLHTDTVTTACRSKAVPDRMSKSSDQIASGWQLSSGSTTPSTPSTPSRTPSSVTRVLAPNGQPRKVPTALLTGQAIHQQSAPTSNFVSTPTSSFKAKLSMYGSGR